MSQILIRSAFLIDFFLFHLTLLRLIPLPNHRRRPPPPPPPPPNIMQDFNNTNAALSSAELLSLICGIHIRFVCGIALYNGSYVT